MSGLHHIREKSNLFLNIWREWQIKSLGAPINKEIKSNELNTGFHSTKQKYGGNIKVRMRGGFRDQIVPRAY